MIIRKFRKKILKLKKADSSTKHTSNAKDLRLGIVNILKNFNDCKKYSKNKILKLKYDSLVITESK